MGNSHIAVEVMVNAWDSPYTVSVGDHLTANLGIIATLDIVCQH